MQCCGVTLLRLLDGFTVTSQLEEAAAAEYPVLLSVSGGRLPASQAPVALMLWWEVLSLPKPSIDGQ